MGVLASTLRPRGVGVAPSFSIIRKRFCSVMKNPGAIAFTRTPSGARCVASHLVKLSTAALAAPYAPTLVRGWKAAMEEMLTMHPPEAASSSPNTWEGRMVPIMLRRFTYSKPSMSMPKKP